MNNDFITDAELAAIEHVEEIESHGFTHSVTSCPPFSRAMCRHRMALASIEVRKILEPMEGNESSE